MNQEMWQSIPVPDLNQPFKDANRLRERVLFHDAYIFTDRRDSIGRHAKEKLLREDVEKLSSLFAEHGLSIPENPYDKIRFLGQHMYSLAQKKFGATADLGFAAGDNRFGFVNCFAGNYYDLEYDLIPGTTIKHTFIHEVIHCSEAMGEWKHTQNGQIVKSRGLSISGPLIEPLLTSGGDRYNEGLAEYLVDVVRPISVKFYPGEQKVITTLVEKVGLDLLMQANYSMSNTSVLANTMYEALGENALLELLLTMGAEYQMHKKQDENKNERTPTEYPAALAFIAEAD
jgi:hypothetical protein